MHISKVIKSRLPDADFDTENDQITAWRNKAVPQPTKKQIKAWIDEDAKIEADKKNEAEKEESNKNALKKSIREKFKVLDLTDEEFGLLGV